MNKLYKIAQYFQSKLARKKEEMIFFPGDIVYYVDPQKLGIVADSNDQFTTVDFQDGFRKLPTFKLTFFDTYQNALNFREELSEVTPIEINKDYPLFSDEYFSFK